MLLSILALGGSILAATTVAGLLIIYQIRQTTDLANSTKAIFAADSGIEWGLYSFFKPPQGALPSFSNGASLSVICYGSSSKQLPACDGSGGVPTTIISKGTSGISKRAFNLNLNGATTTTP